MPKGYRIANLDASRSRQTGIEFNDHETALACYRSAEYQAVRALRIEVSSADLVIAEGYDGPQPGET